MNKSQLLQELFQQDVKITDPRYGKSAKWRNHKHPENPDFAQTVFWVAHENSDKSKIIVRYALDTQYSKVYNHAVLDHSGDFENDVFNFWTT